MLLCLHFFRFREENIDKRVITKFVSFYISALPPSQGDTTKISDQKHSNPKAQDTTTKQRLIHVDYDLFKVSYAVNVTQIFCLIKKTS